ncbi:hypothetical protein LCGC14_1796660 [marine sediment metagenome]|uniref:Uncharacterized protein n=1 Tax=marine sediment metagenome TaxID=412755 RepID=A0A0F9J5N4_9ZZZZ
MRLTEKIALARSKLCQAAHEYVQALDATHASLEVHVAKLETAAIEYTILRQEQFAEENK